MLTDEELTTRLSAAFHEACPKLTYAGPVPHVAGAAPGSPRPPPWPSPDMVLVPAALAERPSGPRRRTERWAHLGKRESSGHRVVRTLDIAGLHLSFATTKGDPGPVYAVLGDNLEVPEDAEKVDVNTPGQYWFREKPPSGEPQVYGRTTAVSRHDSGL